jgi:hypothetical protein
MKPLCEWRELYLLLQLLLANCMKGSISSTTLEATCKRPNLNSGHHENVGSVIHSYSIAEYG